MIKIALNGRMQFTILLMVLVHTAAFVPLPASTSLSLPNVAIPPLSNRYARLNGKLESLRSTSNSEDNQNVTNDIEWKSCQLKSIQNVASVMLCFGLVNACLPAHAKIANALPPPEASSSSSTILSMDSVSPATSIFNLRQSTAFQSLPREPPMQQAERQLRSIADLQDEKLAQCIDRGVYWEQCFMDGMRDDANGIDYQWGSPEAALELKPSAKPSPFALLGNGEKDKNTINPRPPTW